MQINSMVQGMMDISQAAPGKGGAQGVSSQESQFDAMLQERSQETQEKPAEKPEGADKAETPEKPRQPQETQEEEPTEAGYAVAASLVMAQPAVVLDVQQPAPVAQAQPMQAVEAVAEAAPPVAGQEAAPVLQGQPTQPVQPQEAPESAEGLGFQEEAQQVPVVEGQPEAQQVQVEAEPQQQQAVSQAEVEKAPVQEEDAPEKVEVREADSQPQPVFQRETAAPVKVAENYEPVAPEEPEAPRQLADRLVQMLEQGDTRVQIALNPENLGQMTVEITRSVDGALHVVLGAVSEKATALLRQNSADLQGLLAAASQGDVRVEVQEQQPQEQLNQFLNPDEQGRQQQSQQRKPRQQAESEDFVQQLRLGLAGRDGE